MGEGKREREERERERERGRGGGGERKREAKGTETSLLCSFQQKLVVVNNAHYGIHRGGGGEGREGDEGGREMEGEVYISWGSFWSTTGLLCPLTFSVSRDRAKMHWDLFSPPTHAALRLWVQGYGGWSSSSSSSAHTEIDAIHLAKRGIMMIGAKALDTCGHTHDKDQYGEAT